MPKNKSYFGVSRDAIAGGVAGGVARLLTSPFDVLKIRFQLQSHEKPKYTRMMQAFKVITFEEGFLSLWKGNLSATYLYVTYAMVQFSVYNFLKTNLTLVPEPFKSITHSSDHMENSKSWTSIMLFCAGAGAGISATMSTYPLDIMRTQFALQGQVKVYNTMSSFVITTFQKKGIRGFYAGMFPAMVGIAPYMGLNFAIYEALNRFIDGHFHYFSPAITNPAYIEDLNIHKRTKHPAPVKEESSFFSTTSATAQRLQPIFTVIKKGAMGGLSGGLSKFLVFPLDTIKRRLQSQVLVNTIDSSASAGMLSVAVVRKYSSVRHCVRSVYKHEGVKGFYKGIVPTTAKSIVATAITFGVYETTKDLLIKNEQRSD